MKYHIEKNTVQETLVIPLYGRKQCSELFPTQNMNFLYGHRRLRSAHADICWATKASMTRRSKASSAF